ncbi:MAG TPA: hypothetical protein QGG18_00330 [Rhodospirillales bacterium]|nr:hypothetical protein [Rhodospirillales bacterium]
MKKGPATIGVFFLTIISVTAMVVLIPNPLGGKIIKEAKALGLVSYTSEEATELAYQRCSVCHSEEKILKYCTRCGPPFIVVTHNMRRYVDLMNSRNKEINLDQFTDAEIVAITQVWNALIGNWEGDWPKKDIRKLLESDTALISLLETPLKHRLIEAALEGKKAPGSYERYGIGTIDKPS